MALEVTDEMIRQLTQEWVATLPAQYPEPARPHRFSLLFRWKMRPVLRQARKQETGPVPYRGMRFATAVLVAVLMTFTVAMAVPAIRERVFQMVRAVHEKYSHIYYEQTDGEVSHGEFVRYHPTYIPEGFIQIQDQDVGDSHHERYRNADNLGIMFRQGRLEDTIFDIDTENVEPEEIMLNGNQPAWYLGNKSLKEIYWDDGEYSFTVACHLSREELLKIAESVSAY